MIVHMHLGNFNRFNYRIGFPGGGDRREVFNSDVYENWGNANTVGNGGRIHPSPTAARLQPLRGPRAAGEQPAGVRALFPLDVREVSCMISKYRRLGWLIKEKL